MKIQSLAIMFIIIVLPISLVLQAYTQNRVSTLSEQVLYDSKLNDATYDALKAYQINNLNAGTLESVNSKMRDIKASVNTFFNSISTNFSSLGYTKESIQNYVPAIVYTMYDGYYIYSPYTNRWDAQTQEQHKVDNSYSDGETLFGLKPYVYYSCRYVKNNIDVVITYTLDNYITVQGTIDGEAYNKSGYLLSKVSYDESKDIYKYNGIEIPNTETIYENVYINGSLEYLPCLKRNGNKYYLYNNKVYVIVNGKAIEQSDITADDINKNKSARSYYKEAYEFSDFVKNNLGNLRTSDAVGINLENMSNTFTQEDINIFDFDALDGIESETSNFNTHRMDVIKYSIERNLSIAISNFNNYSNSSVSFQMPELKETDWDKIMNNISVITFLQGMNIGNSIGKIYNGYSIITNTKNKDVVSEDSIYIQVNDGNDGYVHDVTEEGLNSKSDLLGIYNINLEFWSSIDADGNETKYNPVSSLLSYSSIVEKKNIGIAQNQTLKDYLSSNKNVAKAYYTALGRERYGLYRSSL